MPYIMVMGSLSAQHLSKDEGAAVYGLKSEERATLVRELNSSFGMTVAVSSEADRAVRVTQKGLTLVVVNRIHGLLGYDVVSHSMAMTNANRELVSFTMYKKSNPSSLGHGHSHGHGHGHGQSGHGHGQSGRGQREHNQSGHGQREHSQSGHGQREHSQSGHGQREHSQSGHGQREHSQSGHGQREHSQSGHGQREHSQSGHSHIGSHKKGNNMVSL